METRELQLLQSKQRHPSRLDPVQTWFSRSKNRLRKIFKSAPSSASKHIDSFFKSRKVRMTLSDHWMKVAGFTAIDISAFQFNHMLGWAVAGILMLVLEKQVSTDA